MCFNADDRFTVSVSLVAFFSRIANSFLIHTQVDMPTFFALHEGYDLRWRVARSHRDGSGSFALTLS